MEQNEFSAFDPRMLTLEMPQNPPNPPVQFQHPHPYSTAADHQTHQQPTKPLYPNTSKAIQLSPLSCGDDDDHGCEMEEETSKKRMSGAVKCMREEAARVLDDPGKSAWEKKEWMRRKALELEERKVGYEWEAVEIEKKRVKWMSYRSKKEREMEKAKLENQRRMLETERMVLILRRREIELAELESLGKRVDPSSTTG